MLDNGSCQCVREVTLQPNFVHCMHENIYIYMFTYCRVSQTEIQLDTELIHLYNYMICNTLRS